ncbi:MAG: AMP-binding protein, partial [Pseudomonadota bacterium]|nr:AMP-binding protein [Pseudomonadota bacterium]
MHITQVLRRAVQIAGDREATAMEGRRHTYRQLVDRVARLAGALRAKGIATGDRV